MIAQPAEEGCKLHDARGVQRGERLVGDDEGGPAGERLGDGDALAFPARELVGVGAEDAGGVRQPGECEEFRRIARRAVRAQHLGHLDADSQHRVERQHRILENHGDLRAAYRLQFALARR